MWRERKAGRGGGGVQREISRKGVGLGGGARR